MDSRTAPYASGLRALVESATACGIRQHSHARAPFPQSKGLVSRCTAWAEPGAPSRPSWSAARSPCSRARGGDQERWCGHRDRVPPLSSFLARSTRRQRSARGRATGHQSLRDYFAASRAVPQRGSFCFDELGVPLDDAERGSLPARVSRYEMGYFAFLGAPAVPRSRPAGFAAAPIAATVGPMGRRA